MEYLKKIIFIFRLGPSFTTTVNRIRIRVFPRFSNTSVYRIKVMVNLSAEYWAFWGCYQINYTTFDRGLWTWHLTENSTSSYDIVRNALNAMDLNQNITKEIFINEDTAILGLYENEMVCKTPFVTPQLNPFYGIFFVILIISGFNWLVIYCVFDFFVIIE